MSAMYDLANLTKLRPPAAVAAFQAFDKAALTYWRSTAGGLGRRRQPERSWPRPPSSLWPCAPALPSRTARI
jgi:hypothetical protein